MDAKHEFVISGIAGRYPEASNFEMLWEKLISGVPLYSSDDRRWPVGKWPLFFSAQRRVSDKNKRFPCKSDTKVTKKWFKCFSPMMTLFTSPLVSFSSSQSECHFVVFQIVEQLENAAYTVAKFSLTRYYVQEQEWMSWRILRENIFFRYSTSLSTSNLLSLMQNSESTDSISRQEEAKSGLRSTGMQN